MFPTRPGNGGSAETRSGSFSGILSLPLWGVILLVAVCHPAGAATNTYSFAYANRSALLADGWSFLAITNGETRNTEVTDTNVGAVIAYSQTNDSLGLVMRIPCDIGSLWATPYEIPNAVPLLEPSPIANQTRNSLFRSLPTNWISMRLSCSFDLDSNYGGVSLLLYQDDDNYVDIGFRYNTDLAQTFGLVDPRMVALNEEFYGFPHTIRPTTVTASNVILRLDRNTVTDDVTAYWSTNNGLNWVLVGQTSQAITNARLGIAVSGSSFTFPLSDLPVCDLSQATIITTNNYVPPARVLALEPAQLVFNSTVGEANTATQRVNLALRRGTGPVSWTVATNVAWLSASPASGSTPGFCDVTVNSAGRAVGSYRGTLAFSAPGASNNPVIVDVRLIVNPANRVRVATWRGDRAGAMTVSVDDSDPTEFDTLYTNGLAGSYMMWHLIAPPFLHSYYQAGMEVGVHTVNHACFPIHQVAARYELASNLTAVVASVPAPIAQVISMAWPCGFTGIEQEIVAADYFLIARGYNINQLEDPTPNDFMNVKSFNSHEHFPYPPADLKTVVDAAMAQGKWFNMVLHATNDDNGAVAYAATNDIWVAPLGAVIKYILQRDRLIVTNYSATASRVQFNCYRLPIPSSSVRNFEDSFGANDPLTFAVDVSGLSPIRSVSVNGTGRPFTTDGATLRFDLAVTTNAQQVVLTSQANTPPMFTSLIPTQTVNELTFFQIDDPAVDTNSPAQSLTYTLTVTNTATGAVQTNAQITSAGTISWTPAEAQGPGTYRLTVVATDSGWPPLSATNSFVVVVAEVNVAPALPAQNNRTIGAGDVLTVANTATDPDIPANALTYEFLAAPTNAAIASDGIIAWIPTAAQGASTNTITTRVTDDNPFAINAQHLSATNSFQVFVNAALPQVAPMIQSFSISNKIALLQWSAVPGYAYRLQIKGALEDADWTDLQPDILATGTTATASRPLPDSTRSFYRVILLQ